MSDIPDDAHERAFLAAALAFQHEAGADEVIGATSLDRFAAFAAEKAAREAARAGSGDARRSPGAPGPSSRDGAARGPSEPSGGFRAGADAPVAASSAAAIPGMAGEGAGRAAGGRARGAGGSGGGGQASMADGAALAAAAEDLAALAAAAEGFASPEALALKEGATRFVFADGRPGARLMIVGEAPGQEEDRLGKPFVGLAGQLLDRMLAAIGLDRAAEDPRHAVYIANILPWRPPGNRTPTEAEAAAFLPFIERHIALAAPEVLLLLGNTPLRALTGQTGGITRARGQWRTHAATGVETIASFHPAYLLRTSAKKREAWADLLEIANRLDL
ncbi:MAG: uracil-DNA glycosylase [Pseudomonadota bacterium]